MNLWKATGTIGGLTMVSRILGFAREMIFARVMGAGMAADAFALAFLIPNLFRRLFGEGRVQPGLRALCSASACTAKAGWRKRGASPRRCRRCSCRC